ncbi:MAG: hypothetical protein N3G19_00365 [Candidatus Pacearchaeota archaeon]|nr:hypothetical protein [Candidatus Pacearchaeota archaeon]
MKKYFKDFFIALAANVIISNAKTLEELADSAIDKVMIVETSYGNIIIDLLEKESPINTTEITREVYEHKGCIDGKVWKKGCGSICIEMDCRLDGTYSIDENELSTMYPYDKNVLFLPAFEGSDNPLLVLGVERKYSMYNPKIGKIIDGIDIVYKLRDDEEVKIKVIKKTEESPSSLKNTLTNIVDNAKETIGRLFKTNKGFDLPSVVDKDVKKMLVAGLGTYGRGFLVMPHSSIRASDGKVYAINIKSEFSKQKGNKIITPIYLRQISPTKEFNCYYYTLTIDVDGNFISLERDSVGKW